jgi:PD-(D/E)XK nuclease superfamily
MSYENGTSPSRQDLKALEIFLVGNHDLDRLEALLDRFNILEALGVVRQELRHSDFLAFLMDPRGNHGLGDAFVKRLLQSVLISVGDVSASVTPIEIELWNLNRMEIRKEWRHIDIVLLDEDHELAIIVENKIGTGEHSNQLQRYWETVEQHYPGWRIIGVFLTPASPGVANGAERCWTWNRS